MVRAAGVYLRISDDRAGDQLGVRRQEADCLGLATRKGWPVAEVYCDDDVSAYKTRRRPAYTRMLRDLEAGHIDAVIVWHLDRLHRRPVELEHFFEVCDAARVKHLASVTGDVDLSTDDGRFMARILGAVSRKESDDKSRRLKRKHEELARAGKVGGGGTRPFGYEADRMTVRPAEAELIREAATRVLSGEAVRAVLVDWTRRGIVGVGGRPWRTKALMRVLLSPRVAGLRQLQGEVVGEARWPAILDRATHERLRTVLLDPARRNGGAPRRYLLTGGLAVCGLCGANLVARPKADGRRCYVCASPPNFDGCGKIRALAQSLEDLVRDDVLEAVSSPALVEALRALQGTDDHDGDLLRTLRADEEHLTELAQDFYAARLLTRPEYLAARKTLEERIATTKRTLGRSHRAGVLVDASGGVELLRQQWDARDVDWRRLLVATVVERVEVGPAVRGRNTFDPERVKVTWRI